MPILVLIFLAMNLSAAEPVLPAPENVKIIWSEQSLDISWDSVPGAAAYQIYTAERAGLPLKQKRRVNLQPITSGTHFTYLWDVIKGKHERRIKGYRHCISVTALRDTAQRTREGRPSREFCTEYFDGVAGMTDSAALASVLKEGPAVKLCVTADTIQNSAETFLRFMTGTGTLLAAELKSKINPREQGACVPVSAVAVQLMQQHGLTAFRVEGRFIREFHSFVVLNVAGTEFVVDFAADQFLPSSAPVVLPVGRCFITPEGKNGTAGTPVYQVGKVFSAAQSGLSDKKETEIFKAMLRKFKPAQTPL